MLTRNYVGIIFGALASILVGCSDDNAASPAQPLPTDDAGVDSTAEAGLDAAVSEDSAADAASEAEAEASAPSLVFTVEETVTIATAGNGHLAFPDMTKLKDGSLLLVYRSGTKHVDQTGKIMKQFGSADGLTWSQPEVLFDEPNMDDRDPSVALLSNGDVIVNYFQYRTQATPNGTCAAHQIFVGRSHDAGKTFEPFVMLGAGTMAPTNPKLNAAGIWEDDQGKEIIVEATSSAIVELPNGDLLLPYYGGNPLNYANMGLTPKSRIGAYRGKLTGDVWSKEPILADDAKDTWLQEPSLLYNADGSMLMHVRTATGTSPGNPGKMMQAKMAPGGAWGTLTSFPFVGHAPELVRLGNGLLVTGYRELDDAFTHEWVSMSWSKDDGATWSEPIRVEDCMQKECGYPTIVEIDASHFLFGYYAPGGVSIKAALFRHEVK